MAEQIQEQPLKPKERRFCWEYVQDYNATQAAIRAGYAQRSAAKQGCLLLKDPRIRKYIEELQRETRDRLMINHDRMVLELMELVSICKDAKPVMEWDYTRHQMVATGQYQIDSKGAAKALELTARLLGMFDKDATVTAAPVIFTGEEEMKE